MDDERDDAAEQPLVRISHDWTHTCCELWTMSSSRLSLGPRIEPATYRVVVCGGPGDVGPCRPRVVALYPADDVDKVHVRAIQAVAGPVKVGDHVNRKVVAIAPLAVVAPPRVCLAQRLDRRVHEIPVAALMDIGVGKGRRMRDRELVN